MRLCRRNGYARVCPTPAARAIRAGRRSRSMRVPRVPPPASSLRKWSTPVRQPWRGREDLRLLRTARRVERVQGVGDVAAPERRLELRVDDRPAALRLPFLKESAIGVQGFRTALLEDDAPAILLVERQVDLPLPDEGDGDLLPRRQHSKTDRSY